MSTPRPSFFAALSVLIQDWWTRNPLDRGLMGAGLVIVLAAALAVRIGVPDRVIFGLMVAGGLLLAAGFLVDAYQIVAKLLETRLGQLFAALVATCVGAVSMGLAGQVVNQATGLDPTQFDYVIAFLAPLTAGFLLTALSVVITFVVLVWFVIKSGTVGILGWSKPDRDRASSEVEQGVLRLAGVFALVVFISVSWSIGERPYRDALAWSANVFVISLEFHPRDPCAQAGERVRRLSDDVVWVARQKNGELTFDQRACPRTGHQLPRQP